MKRMLMIFLIMMLAKTISFSENTSIPTNQDSIVWITASDLKYANLIFAEHKKLLIDNSLLSEQIVNFTKLTSNLEQINELRLKEIGEYRNLTNSYLNQINDLNKEIKKKNTIIRYWQIGGITVSVGLILFLILK